MRDEGDSLSNVSWAAVPLPLARTIHEGFEVREEEQRTWGCEANQAPKQLLSNEQD